MNIQKNKVVIFDLVYVVLLKTVNNFDIVSFVVLIIQYTMRDQLYLWYFVPFIMLIERYTVSSNITRIS